NPPPHPNPLRPQGRRGSERRRYFMRSMLFVPADSERKLARGIDSGADALILDLEDSVAAANRPTARRLARDFLEAHGADRLLRSLCLLAAAAAEVTAIDTIYTDFKDPEGLKAECLAARRSGFAAKMAIHPAQLAIINEAFSVSAAEREWAERVIAAFAGNPN